jgi:hypothetical protein
MKYIFLLLCRSKDPEAISSKESYFPALYKTLATTYRGLKLETALPQDMEQCWKTEPTAVGYLSPIIYEWYAAECVGSVEILKLIVSSIDSYQLQDIIWRIAKGDLEMFSDSDLIPTISKPGIKKTFHFKFLPLRSHLNCFRQNIKLGNLGAALCLDDTSRTWVQPGQLFTYHSNGGLHSEFRSYDCYIPYA